jgi:hypothetical protein
MVATADKEMEAIQTAFKALEDLDEEGRQRGFAYLSSRLSIPGKAVPPPETGGAETPAAATAPSKYGTFAELFDAAQPVTNGDKVLVAGYWLQNCQSQESWDSQSANTLLKNLGHGLANITAAIDGLKAQKPSLVLQLKKSGTSQQARKTYKVTVTGINAVEAMTRG